MVGTESDQKEFTMTRILFWRLPLIAFLMMCASMLFVPAQAEPNDPMVEVRIERTDQLGDDVHVGDKVTYTLHYRKLSQQTVTVYPRF